MKRNPSKYILLWSLLLVTLFTGCLLGQEAGRSNSYSTVGGIRYYMHTVEKGQTLFAIAKIYGRDVNEIVMDNPEAIDGIRPGQVLKIPVEKKKAATDTAGYKTHKVAKGETMYSITHEFKITEEKLLALNPALKDGLKVGQVLKIEKIQKATTAKAIEGAHKIPADNAAAVKKDSLPVTDSARYLGTMKKEYNIAFLLPIHADEVIASDADKVAHGDEDLPPYSELALRFYEGALLAVDSLKRQGLNAKINVFDLDDRDSLAVINMLKKPELGTMDLFIGPLYGTGFSIVSKYANAHKIPLVAPFTQVNKILFNNPYVCKVSPSSVLQVEQMAHFVADTFHSANIILVNNLNARESSYLSTFQHAANEDLHKYGNQDSVHVCGLAGLSAVLSTTTTNVVVLPSNNQSYVTDFISKLNIMSDKHKIVLFGLQSWLNYDNLDFEYLNNLSVHVPSNVFVDYSSAPASRFVTKFREKYLTEPENSAFIGYDLTLFFLSSLQKYGSGFLKDLPAAAYDGIGISCRFAQYPANSGFENKFVYILKYQDYKLLKAN